MSQDFPFHEYLLSGTPIVQDRNGFVNLLSELASAVLGKVSDSLAVFVNVFDPLTGAWLSPDDSGVPPFALNAQIEASQLQKEWPPQSASRPGGPGLRSILFRETRGLQRTPWLVLVRNDPSNRQKTCESLATFVQVSSRNASGVDAVTEILSWANLEQREERKAHLKSAIEHLTDENFFLNQWKYIYYFITPVQGMRALSGISLFTSGKIECGVLTALTKDLLLVLGRADLELTLELSRDRAKKAARAAIMSRNMSHNIGSHALARIHGSTLEKAEDSRAGASKDAERLLQYLQERMDFVARVATEWPTWREPTFFYADLLRGFLRQGLLLDNLVADEGFPASKITFHVKGPMDTGFVTARWKPASKGPNEAGGGEKEDSASDGFSEFALSGDVKDFLVAIPGGVVGRQAFYGFLENAIRNAAKHNRGETLEVALKVEEARTEGDKPDKRFYLVSYQDNLTTDDKLEPIQKHLERDLIDESGRLVSEGWGIQEMKTYAQYLAYPHSDWQAPNCPKKAPGPLGASAQKRLVNTDNWPANDNVVTYTFGLQRPCLALVPESLVQQGLRDEQQLRAYGIETYEDAVSFDQGFAQRLRALSPGLLYLEAPADNTGPENFLESLKAARLWLPARVLVKPPDEKPDELFASLGKAGLAHRVRVDRENGLPQPATDTGLDGLVIELYRRWLLALATEREYQLPFRLVIYFDRDDATFAQRWARLKSVIDKYKICSTNFIVVYPAYGKGDSSAIQLGPWTARRRTGPLKAVNHQGTWILFDNHGRGRPQDVQNFAFEQHIGSLDGFQNNRQAFELLANVPQGFAGVLFLLQLVESCLAKILVLDERVAGLFLELKKKGSDRLSLGFRDKREVWYQKFFQAGLRLAPFFRWTVERKEHVFCHVGMQEDVGWDGDGDNLPGICFSVAGTVPSIATCSVITSQCKSGELYRSGNAGEMSATNGPPMDAVIVHRGLVERLAEVVSSGIRDLNKQRFSAGFLEVLHGLGARVVVTSGRGAQLEGPFAAYPFLEYSVLEATVVRELCKGSLGKTLAAVT